MAITISGSGITSANIADGTITTDDILASDVVSLKSGRKNLIINGGFDVWQRGTSFTTSTAGGEYTADRWKVYWSASSNTTVTKQTDASGVPFSNYIRIDNTVDADTTWIELNQYVEDYGHLINNTVTLSFWAKASYAIQDAYIYTNAGVVSDAYALTTSWAKYEFTLNLGAGTVAADGALRVLLGTQSAVNADSYIEYGQVQLELGSVATDFEHRSYGEELALCQRYYEIVTAAAAWSWTSTTGVRIYGQFRTEKRVSPSVSGSPIAVTNGNMGATQSSFAGPTTNAYGFNSYCYNFTALNTTRSYVVTSTMYFDAEL